MRLKVLTPAGLACLLAVGGWYAMSSSSEGQVDRPAPKHAIEHADSLSNAFRYVAEVADPSVVSIQTKSKSQNVARTMPGRGFEGENPFKGTPFEDFFKDYENGRQFRGTVPQRQGSGSGMIIDSSGVILTNRHVVGGADEVTVRLWDGREFEGYDIKTDEQSDLAVLRIKDAGNLTPVKLGDSDKMQVGDWVVAVGDPFGLETTVTAGIISGKGRGLRAANGVNFLQTDAAINPGNSGGPLFNLKGEVVGINTAIASNSGGFQGIGFAVPSNTAKWVSEHLLSYGEVRRAYLGVMIQEMNNELAKQFGVNPNSGVLVSQVMDDSPAKNSGLKEGDIIQKFAGHEVHSPRGLQAIVQKLPFDAKQKMEVLRDGKPVSFDVTLRQQPKDFALAVSDENPANPQAAPAEKMPWGLHIADMDKKVAERMGYEGFAGVLVSDVEADSPAAEAGLEQGMLILKVGRQPVTSVKEYEAAIANYKGKDVMLLVRTQTGGSRFVVLNQ